MIPNSDIAYDLAREVIERRAGDAATDPAAKAAHAELADRYADRAWGAHEATHAVGGKC